MLKKLLIGAAFLSIATTVVAQRSELGFGIGTFNYTGDLVKNYNFKHSRPAATVLYRSNINRIVSFRASITGASLPALKNPLMLLLLNVMPHSIFFCWRVRWVSNTTF